MRTRTYYLNQPTKLIDAELHLSSEIKISAWSGTRIKPEIKESCLKILTNIFHRPHNATRLTLMRLNKKDTLRIINAVAKNHEANYQAKITLVLWGYSEIITNEIQQELDEDIFELELVTNPVREIKSRSIHNYNENQPDFDTPDANSFIFENNNSTPSHSTLTTLNTLIAPTNQSDTPTETGNKNPFKKRNYVRTKAVKKRYRDDATDTDSPKRQCTLSESDDSLYNRFSETDSINSDVNSDKDSGELLTPLPVVVEKSIVEPRVTEYTENYDAFNSAVSISIVKEINTSPATAEADISTSHAQPDAQLHNSSSDEVTSPSTPILNINIDEVPLSTPTSHLENNLNFLQAKYNFLIHLCGQSININSLFYHGQTALANTLFDNLASFLDQHINASLETQAVNIPAEVASGAVSVSPFSLFANSTNDNQPIAGRRNTSTP